MTAAADVLVLARKPDHIALELGSDARLAVRRGLPMSEQSGDMPARVPSGQAGSKSMPTNTDPTGSP